LDAPEEGDDSDDDMDNEDDEPEADMIVFTTCTLPREARQLEADPIPDLDRSLQDREDHRRDPAS
jgi:tRNA A37 methylthiotransferase MiaB